MFSDSYKSPLSIIVVDNIERILGEHMIDDDMSVPIGCLSLN